MSFYEIAGLTLLMEPKGKTLLRQGEDYLTNHDKVIDISLTFSENFFAERQKENPHLTENDCEYIWIGAMFYNQILEFDRFMLHSSAVLYEGQTYLFSGNSGIGKSTHAKLWQQYFGMGNVGIINDDKPVIQLGEKGFSVFGTPFSGKTALNMNVCAPLKGICFIERSEECWIKEVSSSEAIALILSQTIRPRDPEQMDILMRILDKVIHEIPIYKMGANISLDAVKIAYDNMR